MRFVNETLPVCRGLLSPARNKAVLRDYECGAGKQQEKETQGQKPMNNRYNFLPAQNVTVGYEMPQLVVAGEEFIKGVRGWPEGPLVAYSAVGCHLLLLYKNPTEWERKEFYETARFALFYKYNTIFLIFKFGNMPWQDAPYHYSLDRGDRHDPQEHINGPGNRLFINCFLINATTGIVDEMRAMTFSPDFTRRFLECVKDQAENPTTHGDHARRVARIYGQYPTPKSMVKDALVVCQGGG